MKNVLSKSSGILIAGICTLVWLPQLTGHAQEPITTVDRFVPHTSTVAANAGENVGIFVREKISERLLETVEQGALEPGKAVLFVHGSLAASIPVFDLPHEDYSWMTRFAESGFDAFSMDHTGFGRSPRPTMDDPCNFSRDDQDFVMPNPLSAHCEPGYAFELTDSQSDWDEIDTVVDYIRNLRGVERVSLVGWSRGGGPRSAGYAARHPGKVDKLVLLAPAYVADEPAEAPAVMPQPGLPMTLQTREMYTLGRWQGRVACSGQVDPGVEPVVWQTLMSIDPVGSAWGAGDGVLRVPNAPRWGWNREYAARVLAPTLILVGEQDFLFEEGQSLYADLTGTQNKVLINMECATHYPFWETFHRQSMLDAAMEWLETGQYELQTRGVFTFEVDIE